MRTSEVSPGRGVPRAYVENENITLAADPVVKYMNRDELQKAIARTRKAMESAAKDLDFTEAARLRDELFSLQKLLENK